MKEFVDIHDYLVSEAIVGDWDGNEELVAEKVNEFYHTIYDLAEEDIQPAELEALLSLVWDMWIGNEELVDIESDDIYDWCRHLLENRHQFLES
jgi:hypothetical protein